MAATMDFGPVGAFAGSHGIVYALYVFVKYGLLLIIIMIVLITHHSFMLMDRSKAGKPTRRINTYRLKSLGTAGMK
jgi:uncharacterized membrane protein YsdA (DUF1294 family)